MVPAKQTGVGGGGGIPQVEAGVASGVSVVQARVCRAVNSQVRMRQSPGTVKQLRGTETPISEREKLSGSL